VGHNIMVIGASMGGVEALSKLVVQFPPDFPAAIFVVQHIIPTSTGNLARLLERAGPLPATLARDGERFQPGHIYVAPPDHHLLVREESLCLTHGPRENRVRPAIDPLFRSAATTHGARVVGMVLTGLQNDGTAGLLAVKRCGGITMVQDPGEAAYPDMPRSALAQVEVDYCLPISKMGAVLYRLTQERPQVISPIPQDLLAEIAMTEHPDKSLNRAEEIGALAPLTCPECGGPLWALQNDKLGRYRCRTGHAFTSETLMTEQSEVTENALWAAVRTMEERGHVLLTLARTRRERGYNDLAVQCEQQAAQLREQAQQIREILLAQG
jgi:two-component system chemotaxis response regulator CheB